MSYNPAQRKQLYIDLGKRIKVARKAHKVSQASLAEALGLSRPSINNIEKGRQQVLVHTLYNITNILNISISDLLPDLEPAIATLSVEEPPAGVNRKEWETIQQIASNVENISLATSGGSDGYSPTANPKAGRKPNKQKQNRRATRPR